MTRNKTGDSRERLPAIERLFLGVHLSVKRFRERTPGMDTAGPATFSLRAWFVLFAKIGTLVRNGEAAIFSCGDFKIVRGVGRGVLLRKIRDVLIRRVYIFSALIPCLTEIRIGRPWDAVMKLPYVFNPR
jgi:hypothetical protein